VGFVAVFYAIFVPLRLAQHDALWFVRVGHVFVTSGHSSPFLSNLRQDRRVGYDGEYYFALAADPRHARDYIGAQAGVVYSRVGYPAVSFLASGGSRAALPAAMLAVNIVALLVGTFAVALWLVRRRVPPWPAVLYGLYPGLIFGVFFDLTEPLAFGLVAVAVLVLNAGSNRRVATAALLMALAVLTRETTVLFVLAAAACIWLERRRSGRRGWLPAGLFVATACVPLLVWRAIVGPYTHQPTQETSHTPLWWLPLRGFLDYRPLDGMHRLILFAVVLPALLAAAAAIVMLVQRRQPVAATLLIANVAAFVLFLPKTVYTDYPAASRAVTGVLLAGLYCLPSWWRRGLGPRAVLAAEAVGWSLAWYVLVSSKYGLPGLDALMA
jgi:hypothetical protein